MEQTGMFALVHHNILLLQALQKNIGEGNFVPYRAYWAKLLKKT
jgi:hypothetical protein